ncbi:hypothetical protein [Bacillus toyonensis]|uniref:hypothetical protein n=1 Tax=Bacillus toyonensis TaxID=155322 RepID=UPI0028530568|nr:hypothetical protein [Bacillus toyonensis]MDR4974610.1 hypothetical protein [Bacillus toyonensis]
MDYFNDLIYLLLSDVSFLWTILELLFVTSCISTILFIRTKNQYISYLSAGPIFYILSYLLFDYAHLILLILAMTLQALIIILIQNNKSKKELNVNESNEYKQMINQE